MLICHEDHEGSPPRAHSCNEPGICVFTSVLYLAMIHDQALMASKHFLVETENKPEGGLGRFKLILFRFTFCSPSHPPPCLRPPPASIQHPLRHRPSFYSPLLQTQISLRRKDKMKECPLIRRALKTRTFPALTWTQRGRITEEGRFSVLKSLSLVVAAGNVPTD